MRPTSAVRSEPGAIEKVGSHRGGALALGLAMVQKRVLHRLPHAFVHHAARGMDVGEGEIRFVASCDQREVAGLDSLPERLVLGGCGQRFAQSPCERVHADAVHRKPPETEIQGCRRVTPFEGGFGEVGDVARLDVVGVELGEGSSGRRAPTAHRRSPSPRYGSRTPRIGRSWHRRSGRECGEGVYVIGPCERAGRMQEILCARVSPPPVPNSKWAVIGGGRHSSWCIRVFWMTIVSRGTSWNGPRDPVSTAAIRSTVSMPSMTRPNTVYPQP